MTTILAHAGHAAHIHPEDIIVILAIVSAVAVFAFFTRPKKG